MVNFKTLLLTTIATLGLAVKVKAKVSDYRSENNAYENKYKERIQEEKREIKRKLTLFQKFLIIKRLLSNF
jgi:hypothetical protein